MMNPLRILLLSSAFAAATALPCWADQVQGWVKSINSPDNSIVIEDPVSGGEKAVYVHPKVVSGVKRGSVVKATLRSGSDHAESVEVLVAQ